MDLKFCESITEKFELMLKKLLRLFCEKMFFVAVISNYTFTIGITDIIFR